MSLCFVDIFFPLGFCFPSESLSPVGFLCWEFGGCVTSGVLGAVLPLGF